MNQTAYVRDGPENVYCLLGAPRTSAIARRSMRLRVAGWPASVRPIRSRSLERVDGSRPKYRAVRATGMRARSRVPGKSNG